MKSRRMYESPVTRRVGVELEGGFCGSISNEQTVSVKSMTQEYEEFEAEGGFDGTTENGSYSITWE